MNIDGIPYVYLMYNAVCVSGLHYVYKKRLFLVMVLVVIRGLVYSVRSTVAAEDEQLTGVKECEVYMGCIYY